MFLSYCYYSRDHEQLKYRMKISHLQSWSSRWTTQYGLFKDSWHDIYQYVCNAKKAFLQRFSQNEAYELINVMYWWVKMYEVLRWRSGRHNHLWKTCFLNIHNPNRDDINHLNWCIKKSVIYQVCIFVDWMII